MSHFRPHPRFVAIVLSAVVVIVGSGTGCRQQKQTGPSEKVTIAYITSPNSVLVHIAFAKGYFRDEGLEASPQAHSVGKQALNAVLAERADVATVADTPSMYAIMNGKKIAWFATIQTSNGNEAIVARRDRGIGRLSDLKGKVIGSTVGTGGDFFMDSLLTTNGVQRKMVKVVNMLPEEMPAALRTGRVDAVCIWNPVLTQLQREMGEKVQTFYGGTVYTEIFGITADQGFVKNRSETVKKLLRALIRAEALVAKEPEEARRIVAEFTGMDKALLDEVWGIFTFRVTLDQALVVSLEDQTRWALKNRLVKNSDMPNYLDFIYTDGLRAVRPESITIIR